MPTIAEEWIEQGLRKGLLQGIQEGIRQGTIQKSREAILDVLEARFGIPPESTEEAVGNVTHPTLLRMLHKRAVTVESLKVFEELVQRVLE